MSIWGSITGSDAIKDAAKIQAKATREAVAAQREAGDAAVGYYTPYREGGLSAWDRLMQYAGVKGVDAQKAAFDEFKDSPGVEFFKDRGIQAIDRSAAAAGGLKSGRTLIDLDRFGQGLAEQSFGDHKNDLRYLSDTGYGASAASANARLGTAARVGDLTMDGARTQAELAYQRGQIVPNLISGVAGIGADLFGRWIGSRAKKENPYASDPGFAGSSYRPVGSTSRFGGAR
jgi:hypothetical protein